MREAATRVTGGCLCGRVRYEAEVHLRDGLICHCSICRRSSGQPAEITVLIRAGTLRFVRGEPRYFVSSEHGRRGFCGECGARLVWQALRAEDDWLTNLSVGSLDRPEEVRVSRHIHVEAQVPWFRLCEDLPRLTGEEAAAMFEGMRREGE